MSLFNKKPKKRGEKLAELPKLPGLPELPKLPEMPGEESSLPKLPKYPKTMLGEKFSQDMIKENVTGKKEVEARADEFVKEQMMPEPQEIKPSKDFKPSPPPKMGRIKSPKKPIFIRIDKFEESLRIFREAKEKIFGIEKLLSDIKQLKADEEKELAAWEAEIQAIKNQIDIVERDIFSKI